MGLDIAPPELADVETLNEWALQGRLDITKLSFHALGHVSDKYVLLDSGSALGRGCGPLLIAKKPIARGRLAGSRIAIPGRYTTAAMLLGMYEPGCTKMVVMRFDQIMAALARDEVDAGVIIHESRFTYQEQGFQAIQDLGEWWEETSGCPIPLGGIVARRSLGDELLGALNNAIRESVRQAFEEPGRSRDYIRLHAQELEDKVIQEHIGLYVNNFSIELGKEGRNAINFFLTRGRDVGIIPETADLSDLFFSY
jgi:1,4-dihydroxy-6-naphthoate synthase